MNAAPADPIITGPSRRLALVYFAYFGSASILTTYLPLFMQSAGLGDADIGWVFTGRTALTVVAQPLLTSHADRTGRPLRWLKLALVWALFVTCPLPLVTGFALVAAVMWLQAPLMGLVVPLLDATTVRTVGARYSKIRVWGSLGFAVILATFGAAVQGLSYEQVGALAAPVYLILVAAGAIAALTLPRDAAQGEQNGDVATGAKRPRGLVVFLIIGLLHWAALSPYHIFISIYANELALDPAIPGLATAVGVVFEVGAFLIAGRLLSRLDASIWIGVCLLATAVRWWGTGQATSAIELVAWQSLHGLTFGLWYAAIIELLGRFGTLESRAGLQGMFAAVVFGVGGVVGHLTSGQLMQAADGRTTFELAAALELVALLLFLTTRHIWSSASPCGEALGQAAPGREPS